MLEKLISAIVCIALIIGVVFGLAYIANSSRVSLPAVDLRPGYI